MSHDDFGKLDMTHDDFGIFKHESSRFDMICHDLAWFWHDLTWLGMILTWLEASNRPWGSGVHLSAPGPESHLYVDVWVYMYIYIYIIYITQAVERKPWHKSVIKKLYITMCRSKLPTPDTQSCPWYCASMPTRASSTWVQHLWLPWRRPLEIAPTCLRPRGGHLTRSHHHVPSSSPSGVAGTLLILTTLLV